MKPLAQPAPQELTLPPLKEEENTPVVSREVLEERAKRYSFGLSGTFEREQEILSKMSQGREKEFREQEAVLDDMRRYDERMKLVRSVAGLESITPEEQAALGGLMKETSGMAPADRDSFLEKKFGDTLVNYGLVYSQEDGLARKKAVEEALSDPTGAALDGLEESASIAGYLQKVRNKLDEENEEMEKHGWGEWAANAIVDLAPFANLWNLNLAAGGTLPDTYFFEGNLREDLVDKLMSLPAKERWEETMRIHEELKKDNQWGAAYFLENILGQSTSEKWWSNIFGGADYVGLAPAAKSVAKAVGKGAARTAASGVATPARFFNNIGATSQAAVAAVTDGLKINPKARWTRSQQAKLDDIMPDTFTMREVMDGSNMSVREQEYIRQFVANNDVNANLVIFDINKATRQTETEFFELVKKAEDRIRSRAVYFSPDASVKYTPNMQVTNVTRPEQSPFDIGFITVDFGNPKGGGFDSEKQAKTWARFAYNTGDKRIIDKDDGKWYVRVDVPVDETGAADLKATKLADAKASDSITDYIADAIRNPDRFLSEHERGVKKAATHIPQRVMQAMRPMVETFEGLSKKEYNAFLTTLNHNMKVPNSRIVNGRVVESKGVWAKNQGDLEDMYKKMHGRAPTVNESKAYWSYVSLMNLDYNIRRAKYLSESYQAGIEKVNIGQLFTADGVGNSTNNWVKGKIHTSVPEIGDKEIIIAKIEDGGLRELNYSRSADNKTVGNITEEARKEMQRKIDDEGYVLVELAAPDQYPLDNLLDTSNNKFSLTNERVDYVLVKKSQVSTQMLKPTEADTFGYNPGGHWNYLTEKYVAQPKVRETGTGRAHIAGKATYAGLRRESGNASELVDQLNKVRELIRQGDTKAARDFIDQSNLPDDPDELIAKFFDSEPGKNDRIFDPNIPFKLEDPNADIDDETFRVLREAYPNLRRDQEYAVNAMRDIDKKYVGERTAKLDTVNFDQPIWRKEEAPIADALASMNMAAHNAVRGIATDNAKKALVNKWINRYGHLLDADKEDVLKRPVYYFHNGTIDAKHNNKELVMQANIHKRSITNFLGTHDEGRRKFDIYKEKMVSFVEDKFGTKAADYLSESALMTTQDPFKFARGFAFHTKLGMFNPVQLVLQGQSAIHGYAISGNLGNIKHAAVGYWLSSAKGMNPKHLKHLKSIAKKMGVDPDLWEEADTAMRRMGIDLVEGEHALMDSVLDYKIIRNKAGKMLDKGTMFFQMGERVPRINAWHIAYKEWKDANPGKMPNAAQLEKIADRQDLLTNRMTRKSNPVIQQGAWSTMTQFWSWQMRLTENFLGTQLTKAEKGRLFATYSAMYGLPAGVVAAVGLPLNVVSAPLQAVGLNVGSTDIAGDAKKKALEAGIDPNSGWYDLLFNGLADNIVEGLTGKELNISERMGPGGMFLLENIASNEAGIMDILGGASFSIGYDAYRQAIPLFDYLVESAAGNQEYNTRRTFEDIIRALSTVSSINQARLAFDLMNYGEYRFRSGSLAEKDLDTGYAFAAGFGLSPRNIPDAFLKNDMLGKSKGRQTDASAYLKEHRTAVAKMVQMYDRGNTEAAESYKSTANALAEIIRTQYPEEYNKIGFAYKQSSLVENVDRQFQKKYNMRKSMEKAKE